MNIKIDLKIFLFLLLFLLTSQIEIYILLMILACIHELAHLLAGVLLGFKAEEIRITPVGLQISFKVGCEVYNQKVLKGHTLAIKRGIIATAGPMVNFLIAFIALIILKNNPQLTYICGSNITIQTLIYANVLIGVFNLLPIYPLDGGRILKEILHITKGLSTARKYTRIISKTTVVILTAISSIAILYLQNISIVIIIAYLWFLVIKEEKRHEKYIIKKSLININ